MKFICIIFGPILAVAFFVLLTSPYANIPMPDKLPTHERIVAKEK